MFPVMDGRTDAIMKRRTHVAVGGLPPAVQERLAKPTASAGVPPLAPSKVIPPSEHREVV
jgi:hypothetical protein